MAAADYSLDQIYDFDSKTGTITPKDTSVIQGYVGNDIKTVFKLPDGTEIVASTPMGRFVEWFALHMAAVQNVNVQNFAQLLISSAAGQQLDAIAQWFLLYRKPATQTSVNDVILRGDSGTVIPAGMKASNGNGDVFVLQSAVTIGSGGTATGTFVASEYGPISCPEGDLVNIETAYLGLNSIYNPTAGSTGRSIETDDELRDRIEESRFSGIGFVGSIKNALEKISSVKSSIVLENNTSASTSVDGIELAPHSIFVCVDGITDGNRADIAEAIYTNKPCGTGYTHFSTGTPERLNRVTHTDPYGTKYDVYFYEPITTSVQVSVEIKKRSYAGGDIKTDVMEALKAWVGADGKGGSKQFVLGEDVYASDIIKAIEDAIPGIIVITAIVNEGGTNQNVFSTATYLDVPGYSKAVFDMSKITVIERN